MGDPRVQEAVVSLEPDEKEAARDCWTVCFGNSYNDEERVVCAGYDNGDIKMFDLRTNTVRWESNVGNGVVGLEFDRKDIEMNKLLTATLESKFRIYDVRPSTRRKDLPTYQKRPTRRQYGWENICHRT